ncbi:MAG: cupin domain-containing protein [Nitrospinota bacterium]
MSRFKVNERDIPPAKVKREDGWREMNIKWLLSEKTVGCRSALLFKSVIKAGAAHERHIHHKADELVYVISGKGHRWQGDEEWDVGPGDAYFIPRGLAHGACGIDPDDPLTLVGVYVGAGSIEDTGYELIERVEGMP